MYIDTHAHLYLDRFDQDRDAMVARAQDAGVKRILLPAIDVPSIHQALALCEAHEGMFAMAALHPSYVKEARPADLEQVAAICDHPRIVAIGESGLDYYWDRSFDAKQQDYFRWHIRLAIEKDLPLILHSRDKKGEETVYRDLVAILKDEREASGTPERLRGIFHCFTGPRWLADTAQELGFLLGIGGVLTFKNSGLDVLVEELDLAELVLETDAPYLAPSPHRGKRNESAYTALVAQRLAEIKGMNVQDVAAITSANAARLFNL